MQIQQSRYRYRCRYINVELVVQVDDGAGRGNPVTRVSDMIGRRCEGWIPCGEWLSRGSSRSSKPTRDQGPRSWWKSSRNLPSSATSRKVLGQCGYRRPGLGRCCCCGQPRGQNDGDDYFFLYIAVATFLSTGVHGGSTEDLPSVSTK